MNLKNLLKISSVTEGAAQGCRTEERTCAVHATNLTVCIFNVPKFK
jgi:hypothetical protein